jgi:hypothetical protein
LPDNRRRSIDFPPSPGRDWLIELLARGRTAVDIPSAMGDEPKDGYISAT